MNSRNSDFHRVTSQNREIGGDVVATEQKGEKSRKIVLFGKMLLTF